MVPLCFKDTRFGSVRRSCYDGSQMRIGRKKFLLLSCALCLAQTQPEVFDVASVKPQKWTGSGGVGVFLKGNTLDAEHADLNSLIEFAYNLKDFQLSGGPAWVTHGMLDNSELFQVLAKPADGPIPTEEQFRRMLQTLLADRFHLQLHHASKQLPAYDLVVNKGGPRLKESPHDVETQTLISSPTRWSLRIVATHQTIGWLVENQLGGYAGRPVLDKTGLTGNYDFTLEWLQDPTRANAGTSDLPLLSAALQEQLGLRLQPTMAPFDTVVIDHAEKPSEN